MFTSKEMQHKKTRRRQTQLQRFLPQRWVGALQRRLRPTNAKSSTLTSSHYSEEIGSMLSMPATYTGFYEYVDSDEDVSDDGILSLGTLSELGVKTDEYAEYANLEPFRLIPNQSKERKISVKHNHADESENEITPTNTPIPMFKWPEDEGMQDRQEKREVIRLQSMRNIKRRMRTVTQVPHYILNASEFGVGSITMIITTLTIF